MQLHHLYSGGAPLHSQRGPPTSSFRDPASPQHSMGPRIAFSQFPWAPDRRSGQIRHTLTPDLRALGSRSHFFRGRPLITSTIFCQFLTPPCQQLSNIEGPPLKITSKIIDPPPKKFLRTFFLLEIHVGKRFSVRKTLLWKNFIVDVNFS